MFTVVGNGIQKAATAQMIISQMTQLAWTWEWEESLLTIKLLSLYCNIRIYLMQVAGNTSAKFMLLFPRCTKKYFHVFHCSSNFYDCSNVCWPVAICYTTLMLMIIILSTQLSTCTASSPFFSWTEELKSRGKYYGVFHMKKIYDAVQQGSVLTNQHLSTNLYPELYTSLLPTREHLKIIRKRYADEKGWCHHLLFGWRSIRGGLGSILWEHGQGMLVLVILSVMKLGIARLPPVGRCSKQVSPRGMLGKSKRLHLDR